VAIPCQLLPTFKLVAKILAGRSGPLPLAACHKPQGAYAYTV